MAVQESGTIQRDPPASAKWLDWLMQPAEVHGTLGYRVECTSPSLLQRDNDRKVHNWLSSYMQSSLAIPAHWCHCGLSFSPSLSPFSLEQGYDSFTHLLRFQDAGKVFGDCAKIKALSSDE